MLMGPGFENEVVSGRQHPEYFIVCDVHQIVARCVLLMPLVAVRDNMPAHCYVINTPLKLKILYAYKIFLRMTRNYDCLLSNGVPT